jgi:hypothetical protein
MRSDAVGFIAGYALYAPAVTLALAEQVLSVAQRLGHDRLLQVQGGCENGGSYTATVQDSDGNAALSAGDQVQVDLQGCSMAFGGDVLIGLATLQVQAMDAYGRGRLQGELVMVGIGVAVAESISSTPFARVAGGLQLDWLRETLVTRLTLSSRAADDLQLRRGDPVDEWRGMQLQKRVLHDQARVELDLRMEQRSDDLGGRIEVSTTAPMRSYLNTLPEADVAQGRLQITGAGGDRVTVRVLLPGDQQLQADFDDGGNGNVDAIATGTWDGLSASTIWRGFDAFARPLLPIGQQPFGAEANWLALRGLVVGEPLRLQFNRPLADGAQLQARLLDDGPSNTNGVPTVVLPARVRLLGALLLIEPEQPLRHSNRYRVELIDGRGVQDGHVEVVAADGAGLRLSAQDAFATPDTLRPVVRALPLAAWAAPPPLLAGEVLTFSGVDSPALRYTVAYRWQQLDGPPLLLSQPESAQTELRLAPGATGLGWATLRLTLTHVDGQTASTDVRVKTVASLPTVGWWMRAQDLGGRIDWAGADTGERLGGQLSADGRTLGLSYQESSAPIYGWSFNLQATAGQTLQVGRYDNARDFNDSLVLSGTVPGLSATLGSNICMPSVGRFEIFELVRDAQGQLSQLAVDAEVYCGSSTVPWRFSARLNSAVPLPN